MQDAVAHVATLHHDHADTFIEHQMRTLLCFFMLSVSFFPREANGQAADTTHVVCSAYSTLMAWATTREPSQSRLYDGWAERHGQEAVNLARKEGVPAWGQRIVISELFRTLQREVQANPTQLQALVSKHDAPCKQLRELRLRPWS